MQDSLADATDVAEQAISGIRTVRSFSREAAETAQYSSKVQNAFLLGKKMAAGCALSSAPALARFFTSSCRPHRMTVDRLRQLTFDVRPHEGTEASSH